MASSANWHDKEAIEEVQKKALALIELACFTVESRAKELISIPGTAEATHSGTGHKPRQGKRVYGAVRSEPGEPPRKQTGFLRSSVTHEVDKATMTGRVGTNVKYGAYLELGTKRGLLPRPWLRRALDEMRANVDALLRQIKQ